MDYSKVLTYNPLNSHTLRRLVERHLGVRGSLRTIYLTNVFLLKSSNLTPPYNLKFVHGDL